MRRMWYLEEKVEQKFAQYKDAGFDCLLLVGNDGTQDGYMLTKGCGDSTEPGLFRFDEEKEEVKDIIQASLLGTAVIGTEVTIFGG